MWAASFKSLYPKRPPESIHLRTVPSRGAPDTALRHFGELSAFRLALGD